MKSIDSDAIASPRPVSWLTRIDGWWRLVSSAVRRRRYAVVPTARLDDRARGEFLRRLLALLDVDCLLDVGANAGQYRNFARQSAAYRGHVVSFEPIPSHVAQLREAAAVDPRWQIEGYALGPRDGQVDLNVMASTTFSSFLEPDHSRTTAFRGKNRITDRVRVAVRTLDAVLPDLRHALGVRRPFLKLDTQGFDLAVIEGARESLSSIAGVQIEASVTPLYRDMPRLPDVLSTLESHGFRLSGMYPNNPQHFPRLVDVDCFFVNGRMMPTGSGSG